MCTTVKVTKDPTLHAQQAQRNCRVWSEIARTLNARRAILGRKQVVLFHCYGGMHRSPAALATCLMAREGFQAREATEQILWCRPSLRPWKNRDYILWALRHWEALLCKHAHEVFCSLRGSGHGRRSAKCVTATAWSRLQKCRRAGLDGPGRQRSARRHNELQPLNSANSLAQETSYWFLTNPLVFLARLLFYKEARRGETLPLIVDRWTHLL